MQNDEILGEQPSLEGSPYGKFESVEDLKNAYENLEKEFTRKSQLLSEFEKSKGNNLEESANKDVICQEQNMVEEIQTPFWEKEEWNSEVQTFLQENPLAKSHAKEISNMLFQDNAIKSSSRPLEKAWTKWLSKNFKTKEELLQDKEFLADIQKNEIVRRGVIKDYLAQISEKEITPPLFASGDGGSFESVKTPQTLEEVKEVVKKIFSK